MTQLPPVFLTTPLAHRGYHHANSGRPENSIAAIRAAVAAGYGIEIDVQGSHDNQAMVFHDYDLSRLTAETGPVAERTAKILGKLHINASTETIPTLSEVLGEVAGKVPVLIEIKDQDGAMGSNVGPLEGAVATCLNNYAGPVAVMSFNPHSVLEMKRLLPDTPRGLTTAAYDAKNWKILTKELRDTLREIPDYDAAECAFISHEANDLDRPRVLALKSAGAAILCWTIRSRTEEFAARKVADNITFEGYAAHIQNV